MSRRAAYYPMAGGLNLVDSPLDLKPGESVNVLNYECDPRGNYKRFQGYERLDGRPNPAGATYSTLNFDAGISAIAVDDVVGNLAAAPTAYGTVAMITITSGTFAGGDAVGLLVLDVITGSFVDNDTLYVGAVASATANGVLTTAATEALDSTYRQAAIEARRARIGVVPGSGAVRGVWVQGSVKYAFRDNAAGTAGILHKSTATGWAVVDLGAGLPIELGSIAPVAGEVVTGTVSGATGIVIQDVITSGSWAGGNAAGTLYIRAVTGSFVAEAVTGGTAATFSATGVQVPTTIAPGGHYEFQSYNFYGDAAGQRIYGVSGVDKAFQFDGVGYVPISTGMAVDTPQHIRCHRHHLFLSFNGSLQHSLPGDPLLWSVVLGAGEIGIGDTITSLNTLPGDVLGVMSRNSTHFLYGASVRDWNLVSASFDAGAIDWTAQQVNTLMYVDDLGVTTIGTAQTFGDFASTATSQKIQPLVDAQKQNITASMRVKAKDQYRLFFTDKTYVIGTFSKGQLVGWTRGEFADAVYCTCATEDDTSTEILLFGSTNGYVYQSDIGTSYDGVKIEHVLRLAFNHFKSPEYRKRFFKAVVELSSPTSIDINVTVDLSYGSASVAAPVQSSITAFSGGGYWGAAIWESFSWDTAPVANSSIYINGSGSNMNITFQGEGIYDAPHTIQGLTVHYALRGMNR